MVYIGLGRGINLRVVLQINFRDLMVLELLPSAEGGSLVMLQFMFLLTSFGYPGAWSSATALAMALYA